MSKLEFLNKSVYFKVLNWRKILTSICAAKYLLTHCCSPGGFYLNVCCCHDLFLPCRIMNLDFISVLCPDLYSRQSVWKSKEKKILTWIISSEVKTKTLAKTQTILFYCEEYFVYFIGFTIPLGNGRNKLPRSQEICVLVPTLQIISSVTSLL